MSKFVFNPLFRQKLLQFWKVNIDYIEMWSMTENVEDSIGPYTPKTLLCFPGQLHMQRKEVVVLW